MKIIPNYNHYNLNPPAPVILEPQSNPVEDYFEIKVAEHNDEESYENLHIKNFDDMERLYFKELIKNDPIKAIY